MAVGKLLLHGRLLGGARRFGTHGGGQGWRHIVAAARLQLVIIKLMMSVYHRLALKTSSFAAFQQKAQGDVQIVGADATEC